MDQAVLVHADVDERAELRHVADRAFKDHSLDQIPDVFHAVVEARHLEIRTRVATGLFQFAEDVLHRDDAELLVGEQFGPERLQHLGAAHQLGDGLAGRLDHPLHHRVGFRVHTRHVQRIGAATDAQKAGALLERLGPETGHFEQLLARGEGAVGLAPAHHRLGDAARQARDARQQRHAGRVEVDTDRVHAVLDDRVQRACEFALVHVVLVLADADGLRIDLDQFGQRILQTPRNTGRAAQADIDVGHFLRRQFAGRVDRCAGLADHHLVDGKGRGTGLLRHLRQQLDQVGRQLVGLAAGGAVADRDQVHAMLDAQLAQGMERALPVLARLVRKHRGGFDQLAGRIDHRHLDAGANARVQPHHHARPGRRGQQQVAQVVGEDLDRDFFSVFAQPREQVALGRHRQLDAPGPGHAFAQQRVGCAARMAPAQVQRDLAFGQARLARLGLHWQDQLGVQDLQRPPAKHGQRAMRRHAADRLVVGEVVAKLGDIGVVLVLARQQAGLEQALRPEPLAQALHQHRVFGPALRQDVAYAVEHRRDGRKIGAGLAIVKRRGGLQEGFRLHRRIECRIVEQRVGQRFQSELPRNLALGAALLLERQVDVFQLLLGRRELDGSAQCRRQLALLVDAFQHGGAPVFQFAQVRQARFQFAQLDIVQPIGHFLAVAGDEGNGRAPIEQLDGRLDLVLAHLDFGGELANDFLHGRRISCDARRLAVAMAQWADTATTGQQRLRMTPA